MATEDRSAKSKVESQSSPSWAAGGPADGMAKRTGVMTAVAGCTVAHNTGMGGKWGEGGSGGMHSRTPAQKQTPGHTTVPGR